MWAGGSLTFAREIRVGDLVQRKSRIEDVVIKKGRSGTLCFVTVDHELNIGGDVAVREKHDVVYREKPGQTRAAEPETPAQEGQHKKRVAVSSPLLFRYSALTFNGHRIHYDRPYATGEEGYPGLVVHGPLQATLLVQVRGIFARRRNAQDIQFP